jgi:hypothetical protein
MAHHRISRSVEFFGALPRPRRAMRYVAATTKTSPKIGQHVHEEAVRPRGVARGSRDESQGSRAVQASSVAVTEFRPRDEQVQGHRMMAMVAAKTTPTARHWML